MKLLFRAPIALSAILPVFSRTVYTASPTSFCKCTCYSNSTIIPLDNPISVTPNANHLLLPRISEAEDEDQEGDPLDPPEKEPGNTKGKEEGDDGQPRKEYRAKNCNDCNRQFCMELNLPICKGAGMDDVFTTCFQRDSTKDEAVVFIFIIATVGLLAWAAVKPWVGRWVETARERRNYIPVSSGDT